MSRVAVLAAALVLGLAAAPSAQVDRSWSDRVADARSFAATRDGRVAFAVVDERGRLRGGLMQRAPFRSASVVKAMLLVAYLSREGVRDRALTATERELLAPMIRRSANRPATQVRNVVGNAGLHDVARRAGMRDFRSAPSWGSSAITAADQARFFFRIDRLVPRLHRDYARTLLATVVRRDRWGIPRAAPPGSAVYLKGGWRRDGTFRLVHQAAYVERDGTRVALAVLTDGNPDYRHGRRTVRGVAERLLR